MSNPLTSYTALPPFAAIRPEHVEPAIDELIALNRRKIDEVLAAGGPHTYDNLVVVLDEYEDRLDRAFDPAAHLNAVMNNEALREAYNACLPKLSDFAAEIGQNRALYDAYAQIRAGEYAQLDTAQRKVIDNALRDFHLSGIDLPPEQQRRFAEIQSRLAEITSRYSDNVLDATNAWSKLVTDAAQLKGLPESALAQAQQAATQRGQEGWLITLDFPSYYAVITYADDRALREELYTAYCTRASDQGPHAGRFDNSALMTEILALRHEEAVLLGYPNFAELSLATKMAESSDQVLAFLRDLGRKALPAARREIDELKAFARTACGIEDFRSWDASYVAEKLQQAKYSISQEELRPYFPAPKVLAGLFAVAHRLFGVGVCRRDDVELWHPDAQYYDVLDAQGEVIAGFYIDLYARQNKRGGAWMDDCLARWRRLDGSLQKPVAYLVCNFTPPVGADPALLTHDEVTTLFHEFGHGLHHMLTRIDARGVSGISGVAWDAVELPSQFMENWCWEPEALALISGHYRTGEPLPADLLQKMLAAKNFQSAMMMVRQIEFSVFDLRLHREFDPVRGIDIQQVLDEVRAEVAVMQPPAFNRFQHGFSHIFAGGYAAGYYSYKWAEVLSADAFSRFEEEGIFSAQAGADFRAAILERGGSEEAMDLFRRFRGREPQVDALLRHSGIAVGEPS
ncbi:MAG: oligopeptidase A [Gammaproteobacteria bacterium]